MKHHQHKKIEKQKASACRSLLSSSSGFTLIETVIAILILSLSLGALLTLSAGGIFSVRYARNQIVADNLNQEALEYLRNERDTEAIRGTTWTDWVASLPSGCFDADGCRVDPYTSGDRIEACSGDCPFTVFYPLADGGFYGYDGESYPMSVSGVTAVTTTYIRTINMSLPFPEQLVVDAQIEWRNGGMTKRASQSIVMTSWNQ